MTELTPPTATMEYADAAHGLGGHICSDGGMTVPEILLRLSAGANFVMLGGMFAGHRETGLNIISTDW
jgi:GMP reductase